MNEQLAQIVHPVIEYGLGLKKRLESGEKPDLDTEQSQLNELLLTQRESRRWPDYGGDVLHVPGTYQQAQRVEDATEGEFLGVRYALVCWLDELLTEDPAWGKAWNERKLEVELYGTNDRAWRFWQQAQLALMRPGTDSLEVFYLCVMLGFQGEQRNTREQLEQWVGKVRTRLGRVNEPHWPYASQMDPPTNVTPLTGRSRLQQMVLTGWVAVLAAIPTVAFVLLRRIGS